MTHCARRPCPPANPGPCWSDCEESYEGRYDGTRLVQVQLQRQPGRRLRGGRDRRTGRPRTGLQGRDPPVLRCRPRRLGTVLAIRVGALSDWRAGRPPEWRTARPQRVRWRLGASVERSPRAARLMKRSPGSRPGAGFGCGAALFAVDFFGAGFLPPARLAGVAFACLAFFAAGVLRAAYLLRAAESFSRSRTATLAGRALSRARARLSAGRAA